MWLMDRCYQAIVHNNENGNWTERKNTVKILTSVKPPLNQHLT